MALYIYVHVVHELGGEHDAGDEQAVDVEGVDGQRGLSAGEAVEVSVGHNEARRAAVGVLEDPPQVAVDGDRRPRQPLECRRRRRRR